MRTTLRLNDALLADAKRLAIDTGRTLTEVVEDALRIAVTKGNPQRRGKPIKLHTCGEGGLQPGVDLSNNAALLELMDEYDGFTGR